MTSLRNVRGVNPNEVAIIGKPTNTMSQNKIQIEKNRFYDNHYEKLINEKNQMFNQELKINFMKEVDIKAKNNRLKRNVEEIMNQRHFLLNERRSNLKHLLLKEQEDYEKELLSKAITPLERAAKLREKAKQIKNNKENEMALYVQEKLDQKWRSECDELRLFESKQLQAGMRSEHLRQIEEKICKERHRLREEAIFADLWQKDFEAKTEKENEILRAKSERNKEMSRILKEQMQTLENQKLEEKRLRNENIRLIEEKMNIDELEKKIEFKKKRESQAERRHELDICVRAKLINEAKMAKEELSFDLKMLEDSMKSFQNEDEERAKRKIELLEEQQKYREYLKAEYEEEKRKEKELEKIIQEEIDKQFQKRLNEWKLQKQARKALLEKVLAERKIQIEEKLQRNKEKELKLEIEKNEQIKLIQYYKEQDKLDKLERTKKIHDYNADLQGQMEYNRYQKSIIEDSKEVEFKNFLKTEEDYGKKLNEKMEMIEQLSIKRRPEINKGFCYQCKDDLKIQ